ncbi:unnamed protein product [Calypogeia fissa]
MSWPLFEHEFAWTNHQVEVFDFLAQSTNSAFLLRALGYGSQAIANQSTNALRGKILKEEGLELDAEDPSKPSTELAVAVDKIEVVENGIQYKASLNGQKTGFYADQRDSRLVLRALCRNKTILDLCCYNGGFSLNAVVGGASHVTGMTS